MNKLKKINDKHMCIFGIFLIVLSIVNIIIYNRYGNTKAMIFYIIMLVVSFAFLIIYMNRHNISKSNTSFSDTNTSNSNLTSSNTYIQLSIPEAKNIINTSNDYIILDVRSNDEYVHEHIDNAINIPHITILSGDLSLLTNKEQLILIYSGSGIKSKDVAFYLAKLGYSNIYEFGGILDWDF